jgi:UDP-N-acetylmuramate--alanine ligase
MIPRVSDRRIVTYGFSPQADIRATNIEIGPDGATYDVTIVDRLQGGETRTIEGMKLPMVGRHNVQNSLAAIAVAHEMRVPDETIKKALAGFSGVKRRFTRTGEAGGITVIDDYGHHPVEIQAVLAAARTATRAGVVAVVQPHRYSRLSGLFEEFCSCFNDADTVIVAEVYAAGEKPIEGANRDALVEGLRRRGHRHVLPLPDRAALAETVASVAKPGDLVVCLGAGDITYWAAALPDELQALQGGARRAGGAG